MPSSWFRLFSSSPFRCMFPTVELLVSFLPDLHNAAAAAGFTLPPHHNTVSSRFMFRGHPLKTALLTAKDRRARGILRFPMPSTKICNDFPPSSRQITAAVASGSTDDVAAPGWRGGGALSGFEFPGGYRPSDILSDDENYMDMVMIITRFSKLRQGSMGCILVRPSTGVTTTANDREGGRVVANVDDDDDDDDRHYSRLRRDDDDRGGGMIDRDIFGRIIAAATNTSLFRRDDSDVHAEINAIGQVAAGRHRHFCAIRAQRESSARDDDNVDEDAYSTRGATAYITMPPCKRCFGALHACGIKRIVSRVEHPNSLLLAARDVGIDMSCLTREQSSDQKVRLDRLFARAPQKS
jgi:tRNA(Arg) A34 adenosine deaminase TadA